MELIKIYDETCDICLMLAEFDKEIAKSYQMSFKQVTVEELAQTNSLLKDYVIPIYVTPNDGMIDLPIYLLVTPQDEIQASGVIQTVEELNNLINSWIKWASFKSV